MEQYSFRDGRKLKCAGRRPPFPAEYNVGNHSQPENRVYAVPEDLDKQDARLKLESMGVKIDRLTAEQEHYLASWSGGT